MPINPTYPGVYIEEIPSGVRTITGVATSITAFIGRALRGPVDFPIRIQSFADFERAFGGLWVESTLGYAVRQFFQHGGTDGLIVRVFNGDVPNSTATITLPTATGSLVLEAAGATANGNRISPGTWGNNLRAVVDHDTRDADLPLADQDTNLFNLAIREVRVAADGTETTVNEEHFLNVSVDPNDSRFVNIVLEQTSSLARVRSDAPVDERPTASALDGDGNPIPTATDDGGGDGIDPTDTEIVGVQNDRTGLYALEEADLFNLLCIPPLTRANGDVDPATWAEAAAYCQERRAMLIVDPPVAWNTIDTAETGVNAIRQSIGTDDARNAAVYFPRLRMADPLNENRLATFAPCGAVAGIIARTDAQRGVWKAPAGLEASFSGVREFSLRMTDAQNGRLNPLGLNCLRTFPVTGNVVWGARTLAGADRLASEWKYLPVRRLALYLEESLYRGTQWVVFEPNDEPLWAQIRLNVGAFMQNLFRQGAFQGRSPREAYFVRCDSTTTTQNDIDRGIVNIAVGFAPLKPAEFVIIQIQQMAGQIEV
jgi:hypothetical protein